MLEDLVADDDVDARIRPGKSPGFEVDSRHLQAALLGFHGRALVDLDPEHPLGSQRRPAAAAELAVPAADVEQGRALSLATDSPQQTLDLDSHLEQGLVAEVAHRIVSATSSRIRAEKRARENSAARSQSRSRSHSRAATCSTAARSDSTVGSATRTPSTPSRTMSRAPPAFRAITGDPAASASTMVIPKSSSPTWRKPAASA